jgi:hypothetical protein
MVNEIAKEMHILVLKRSRRGLASNAKGNI